LSRSPAFGKWYTDDDSADKPYWAPEPIEKTGSGPFKPFLTVSIATGKILLDNRKEIMGWGSRTNKEA
jgi:hypothetical protein